MLFAKIKFSRKCPNLQYHTLTRIYEHFANVMLKHLSMNNSVHVPCSGAHCGLASVHALDSFQPANGIVPLSACQQNVIYMQIACHCRPVSKTLFTCKWRVTTFVTACQQNVIYMQTAYHYRHVSKTSFTYKWCAIIGLSAKRHLHENGVPILALRSAKRHLHANAVPLSACQQTPFTCNWCATIVHCTVSKTPFTCKRRTTNGMSVKPYLHINGVPLSAYQQNAIYMKMTCQY